MPRSLVITGPPPPVDELWCAVCVAIWKSALLEQLDITAEWFDREIFKGDPAKPPVVLHARPGMRLPALWPAVTSAPITRLGGTGVVCWSHADAFAIEDPDAPTVRRPPGLLPGLSLSKRAGRMTDHEAATVRRVLREHGHTVPERGVLSAANVELYEQLTSDSYDPGVSPGDFGPEEPGIPGPVMDDITAGPEPAPPPQDDDPPEELRREQTPRSSVPPASARVRDLLGGRRKRTRKRGRKRLDWVPTGPVIERTWLELAQSLRRMPPIQRIMAAQAPMVGVVLQDTARDTIADRLLLQKMARYEDTWEALNACFGPLVWTLAIMRFGDFNVEPAIDAGGRPLMHDGQPVMKPVIDPDTGMPDWQDGTRVMIGGLRMSLMSWLRISQRHAEEIIARAEEIDQLGAQADALIAYILSAPRGKQRFSDLEREARARFGAFMPGSDEPAAADEAPVPQPAPATPGHSTEVAIRLDSYPYPAPPAPDPRTLSFLPPDPAVASQVVPRAVVPQG